MARRATLIDQLREENPNLLLYEGGSFANQRALIGEVATSFIVRALDTLGYSAMTIGIRELKYGAEPYPLDGSPPVLLTNVYRKGPDGPVPISRRYVIDEVAGVRVGAFGLLTEHLPQHITNVVPEWRVRDPFEVARETIDALEAEGVEIIVLLSQLERTVIDPLLLEFPEIDVAIMGHETTPFTGRPDACEALTLYGTPRGQAVPSAVITLAPDGAKLATETFIHDLGRGIPLQPAMAAMVAEADAELTELTQNESLRRRKEIADAEEANRSIFVGGESCAACHDSEQAQWQTSAHARAFETLENLGVQSSDECLACHTVGFGEEFGFESAKKAPNLTGVQCESCHGRGSRHYEPLTAESIEAVCVRCHDAANSPDFDLPEYLEKIRHW